MIKNKGKHALVHDQKQNILNYTFTSSFGLGVGQKSSS